MEYIGTTGKTYKIVEPAIGKGGEGSVYKISNMPNSVLKVFLEAKRTETRHKKLLAMLSTPLSADAMNQITWPIDVVYENGDFVGYVMPAIKNNEDLNVMYSDKYTCSLSDKITIAKNLCAAINSVHEANQVCGDLNPKNISVDPQCAIVTLVDTDSYHITETDNSRVYRCEVGLPEYLPREIQEKMKNGQNLATAPLPTFTRQSDLFALAVHIFALLMNGCHPFACAIDNRQNINHLSISKVSVVAPQPIDNICSGFFPFYDKKPGITTPKYAPSFDYLPKNIQELFVRAFVKGHANPSLRPTAVEWYNALTTMQGGLKICSKEKHHMYPGHDNSCPWCAINAVLSAVNRPSGFASNTIKQTIINGNQHYTAQQNKNVVTANGSHTQIGKIVVVVICVLIGILLLKSCFDGNDTSDHNINGNDYSYGTTSSNGYNDSDDDDYNNKINDIEDNTSSTLSSAPKFKELLIEPYSLKSTSISQYNKADKTVSSASFKYYSGTVFQNPQEDTYSFTTTETGIYRIELYDMVSGFNVSMYLYDSNGYRIDYNTGIGSGSGLTVPLNSNSTYELVIKNSTGSGSYKLFIGQQKPTEDITGYTTINDSIEFSGQQNNYFFTPSVSGVYRFCIAQINSGIKVSMYVYDDAGYRVDYNTGIGQNSGVTVALEANKTYSLQIKQSSNVGNYTLSIGYQKATTDITGYTTINDSIEFSGQQNDYFFTPSVSGVYRFYIAQINSGIKVSMYVYDDAGYRVDYNTGIGQNSGVTVALEANKTYSLQIKQSSNVGNYTLATGYQKVTTDISNYDVISDSIQFSGQENNYTYVPTNSGKYSFYVSNINSGSSISIYVYDSAGYRVDYNSGMYEGNTLKVNLEANNTYSVVIKQSSGSGIYTIGITN